MTTPFSAYANATLTFQLPFETGQIDALGNPLAITQAFPVSAYLKDASGNRGSQRQGDFDGGLDSQVFIEGRCVSPASLPAEIVAGTHAIATIGGVEGDFYLTATIPSAFGVDAILGTKIKGRFVARIVFGESL